MNGDKSVERVRLHADSPLWHEEGACLPLRSRHGQCTACADACPVGVLQVSVEQVLLADGCIACGRCSAACPTQALGLPELASLAGTASAPRAATVRLECRKVPATSHAANTVTVPCLGAVTTGHLLAQQAAGQVVQVVDRGWCAQCQAGGTGPHPVQGALDAAVVWLQAVGESEAPVLLDEPLPLHQMPAQIPPAPEEAPRIDRRSFFRDALQRPAGRQGAAATTMGSHGRAAYPADRRRPSPERARQLTALTALAQTHDSAVPAEFFARLHVEARCCDQRLCVAVCPTAALTVQESDGSASLHFSPERCIACGTCVRACPEGAMTLTPHAGEPGPQVLATHLRRSCPSCGEVFTPAAAAADDTEGLCPTCTKSRRFMEDARRQLFGRAVQAPH